MRCPKCGYISFDRLDKCRKCKTDLAAVSEKLAGTSVHVEAPGFLAHVLGQESESYAEAVAEPYEAPVSLEDEEEVAAASVEAESVEEEPAMRSLGLQDIDVSDLIPTPEEEGPSLEESEDAREENEEAAAEEEGEGEIPFGGISAESLLAPEEETPEAEEAEAGDGGFPEGEAVEEDVVDLSDLMSVAEEETGEDIEEDLSLDISLGRDEEEEPSRDEEEMNFDFESGIEDVSEIKLTLESDEEQDEDKEKKNPAGSNLKLEMDDKDE